ncbi:MAG: hypothetical protein V3U35_02010 [Candidatus Neomarinimicrobiota bacterium]
MFKNINAGIVALFVASLIPSSSYAHEGLVLHVLDRWDGCSIQLDPALTQDAWQKFTREAGLIAYFRTLSSAKPLGARKFEIIMTQGRAPIDDTDPAWNDTFVHPHSTHWLYAEVSDEPDETTAGHADSRHTLNLPLPLVRIGITDRIDISGTFLMAPGANYGFGGVQLQYNLLNDTENNLAAAARIGAMSIVGVEDLNLTAYSIELIASKDISRFSVYGGLGTYLMHSHETTSAVDLDDENLLGLQGMVGVNTTLFSHLRIGAEMSLSALTMPVIVIGYSR